MKKLLLLVLLILPACTVKRTESQVAHWHGYQATDRRPQFERFPSQRCYGRGGEVRCFDLNAETEINYEVTP